MNDTAAGPVRHIVAVRFRPGAGEAQIGTLIEAFCGLKERIPGITGFEYGANNSPEGLDRGFTHIFLLTMESVAARNAYLPHPEHKKFGELVGRLGIVEEFFVVDFVPDQPGT